MPKKTDINQVEVVKRLRECGLHVIHLHTVGRGVPDLLVTGYNQVVDAVVALLVEVKTATGKLTPDQVAWHNEYPGDGPLIVARSAEDVLAWFGMV